MRIRRRSLTLAAVAVLASIAGSFALGTAAASAQPEPPQLSISVTDEKDATTSGDELAYAITVQNIGATDLPGLVIAQTLPAELTPVSSDPAATQDGPTVGWTIDLAASQTVTLTSTATVGETPDDLLRLATTVCASTSPTDAPLVCASDSDLLPAGAAAAEAETAASESEAAAASTAWVLPVAIGAVVVIAVLVLLVLLLRRRRRRRV